MENEVILSVEDLRTHFFTRSGVVKAVDGISFDLRKGETLGIVGESGSGKSMTAWSILGMVPQPSGKIVSGSIIYQGEDLIKKSEEDMRDIRGSGICMVMQDPLTSLNPVFTIEDQIVETLERDGGEKSGFKERARELLELVHIPDPLARLASYPHQMSGGMRQRVVGSIAMSRSPNVLIADEPTTSLDATIQLQYLKLLKEIQAETGTAIIFITHDFGVVARMCDRVAVMYAGKIVEQAEVAELFDNPSHPYTEALLKSVPNVNEDLDILPSIEGQPPAPDDLPVGCSFAPRCQYAFDKCSTEPGVFQIGDDHVSSCWRNE